MDFQDLGKLALQNIAATQQAELVKWQQLADMVAPKLHDKNCPDRHLLISGYQCCQTNMWSGKAQKVAEALVYAYAQTLMHAPHDHREPCIGLEPAITVGCMCWKKTITTTMLEFMENIARQPHG